MTPTILHILQHALGRDAYGRRKPGLAESYGNNPGLEDYRNHYCAGGDAVAPCREAVAAGWMAEHPGSLLSGGDPVFVVTEAGKRYVDEHSPRPPRLTLGQQRYRRWLDVGDAVGLTFGQWLKEGAAR